MKKIFRIDYADMLEALSPSPGRPRRVVKKGTIPPGAVIVSVHENYQARCFDFILQHESFPPTAPGCMLLVVPVELEDERSDEQLEDDVQEIRSDDSDPREDRIVDQGDR